MTLILALRVALSNGECILVTSDSKATSEYNVAYQTRNVHTIMFYDKPVAMAGYAGDPPIVKWGLEVAQDTLLYYAEREYPLKFITLRKAIAEIEATYIRRFKDYRTLGITPNFRMLICTLDYDAKASIHLFDERGLGEPRHDNPGYAIVGSGQLSGGTVLLRLLGYINGASIGILTAFIIDRLSEIDPTVGPFTGESYLMTMNESDQDKKEILIGYPNSEALLQLKERSTKRKELIRKLWQLCDRPNGENTVEQALDSITKLETGKTIDHNRGQQETNETRQKSNLQENQKEKPQ